MDIKNVKRSGKAFLAFIIILVVMAGVSCRTNSAGDISAKDIIDLYKTALRQSDNGLAYHLYDIDNNNVPELIIKTGRDEAHCMFEFYTATARGLKSVGTLGGAYSVLYKSDNGGICRLIANAGYIVIYQISLVGSTVSETNTFEKELVDQENENDYYPSAGELEWVDLTDYSLLYNVIGITPTDPSDLSAHQTYGINNLFTCLTTKVNNELIGTYAFAVKSSSYEAGRTYNILAKKADGTEVIIAAGLKNIQDLWYANGTLYFSSLDYSDISSYTSSYSTVDLASSNYAIQEYKQPAIHIVPGSDDKNIYYTEKNYVSWVETFNRYSLSYKKVTELLQNTNDKYFIKVYPNRNSIYYINYYYPAEDAEPIEILYKNNLAFSDQKEILNDFKFLYILGNHFIYEDTKTGYINSFDMNTSDQTIRILIQRNDIQSVLFKGDYAYYSVKDVSTDKISIYKYDGQTETAIYQYAGKANHLRLDDFEKDRIQVYLSIGEGGEGMFVIDTNGNKVGGPDYEYNVYYIS